MSNTDIKHTGLKARLESLPKEQAATVGDLLELANIVNHNIYKASDGAKKLQAKLDHQMTINKGLIETLSVMSKNITNMGGRIESVWDTVNVIDKDLDGAYDDINLLNGDAGIKYVRPSDLTDEDEVVCYVDKARGDCTGVCTLQFTDNDGKAYDFDIGNLSNYIVE